MFSSQNILRQRLYSGALGTNSVPPVDPLGPQDGQARGEDHQEDDNDAEQDEGAGPEREVLQVAAGECS